MNAPRKIRSISTSQPVIEGAGVYLKRAFGFHETPQFDPFLLLDDFRSHNPEDYLQGFPWHPHRGIETITYVLQGDVEHGDSMGHKGDITSGDVQWMTAGSGIIHQEMPKGDAQGRMEGFQLWANLPAANKMMEPRYRNITAGQIPTAILDNDIAVKVICGRVNGTTGPVKDIVIEPQYLDIAMPARTTLRHPTPPGHTVFAYVIEGSGLFGPENSPAGNTALVLFADGDHIIVKTEAGPVRFLLISGKPIGEPIAWRGPIVMNTAEELQTAFAEYNNGTFIK